MIATVHRVLALCGPHAKRIRAAYLFSFLKSLFMNMPIFLAWIAISGIIEGSLDIGACFGIAGAAFGCMALQAVFQHASDRLQSASGYEVFADVRLKLGEHLRRLPMGYFTAGNIGRISSVLASDMVFIEENAMGIVADVASYLFSQLILTVFLFALNPLLGVVALATEIVVIAIARPMAKSDARNSAERQASVEELASSVLEYVEGISVIKSFSLTGENANDLRQAFARSAEANLDFERKHTPWFRAQLVVFACGMAAIFAIAIGLFETGQLPVGHFVGVMLFLFSMFTPLRSLYEIGTRITIMEVGLDRIESIFAQAPLDNSGAAQLPTPGADCTNTVPEVEFSHVTFGYGGEDVLRDMSFEIERGSMVALVGESGSGKTTVANLLARFWDVQDGAVLVRGVDVRDLPMETLMGQISMVFQNVYLFQDTVFNNIAMGRPDATAEEVREAARKARCHDFISELPYGFDTVIGEGGASLSGGEAQRISIARCILKDAPIIVLDEATASIDADNERAIQQALTELCRNKTTLVIAHRLGTIRNADRIVVLDGGRVEAVGAHDELLAGCERYRRLVLAQEGSRTWYRREGEVL